MTGIEDIKQEYVEGTITKKQFRHKIIGLCLFRLSYLQNQLQTGALLEEQIEVDETLYSGLLFDAVTNGMLYPKTKKEGTP